MRTDEFVYVEDAIESFNKVFNIALEVLQVAGHQNLVGQLSLDWHKVTMHLNELKED